LGRFLEKGGGKTMGDGWREFVGLQSIADYYGISLSSLKKKHVKDMLACQAILVRTIGRPAKKQYFAWENRLQNYAAAICRKGYTL